MQTVFIILAAISAILTLVAMGAGIVSIGKNAEFRKKYANKLMQGRVVFQGLTLLFLFLAFAL